MAAGALHAAPRQVGVVAGQVLREAPRVGRPSAFRSSVSAGRSGGMRAPRGVEALRLRPGRHRQQQRPVAAAAGGACQQRQRRRLGPVHVLQRQQHGASGCTGAAAPPARRRCRARGRAVQRRMCRARGLGYGVAEQREHVGLVRLTQPGIGKAIAQRLRVGVGAAGAAGR